MLASSVFAVDFSADVYLEGNIATFTPKADDADANIQFFKIKDWNANNDGNHYVLNTSFSGDKAGAKFAIGNNDLTLNSWAIWIQPIDQLKITVGQVDTKSIAYPQFGDWGSVAGYSAAGIQADLTVDDNSKDGYGKIGSFWADGRYSIDGIGTFQVYVTKAPTTISQMTGYCYKTANLQFGLAYANMPYNQTGFYAEAGATVGDYRADDFGSLDAIVGGIGGQFVSGAFAIRLNVPLYYGLNNAVYNWADYSSEPQSWQCCIEKGTFRVGGDLKASYALDAVTLWGRFKAYKIMDKAFTVSVGLDGTFGSLGYGCEVDVNFDNVDDKVGFKGVDVPFYLEVKF